MIFMDIIMPRLDGVSATMYIRQVHPAIPIIAMTSNIRPEEVNGYFEHGALKVLSRFPVGCKADNDRHERCLGQALHERWDVEIGSKPPWPSYEESSTRHGDGLRVWLLHGRAVFERGAEV